MQELRCAKSSRKSPRFSPASELSDSQDIFSAGLAHCSMEKNATQLTSVRVLYALIAATAFCCNLLLIVVLIKRRRQMLKKPYNILIFNLAITDMLTGIFIVLGPRLVISESSFPARRGIWGEFHCRALSNHVFIFVFGKASNLTLMCLAIERWFAFVRPIRYKVAFTRPRMLKYLAVIWVLSVASRAYSVFARHVSNGRCVGDSTLPLAHAQPLIVVHVLLTFILPVAVTWGTFAHLWRRMKTSVAVGVTSQGGARLRLLRMCVLAALFLTLCWLPSECSFILVRFKLIPKTKILGVLGLMSGMLNSCVNPLLYCFSNREYKNEFVSVLCFWREERKIGPAVAHPRTPSTVRQGRCACMADRGVFAEEIC